MSQCHSVTRGGGSVIKCDKVRQVLRGGTGRNKEIKEVKEVKEIKDSSLNSPTALPP